MEKKMETPQPQEIWFISLPHVNDGTSCYVDPVIVMEVEADQPILAVPVVSGKFLEERNLKEEYDVEVHSEFLDYLIKPSPIARLGHMDCIDMENFVERKEKLSTEVWEKLQAKYEQLKKSYQLESTESENKLKMLQDRYCRNVESLVYLGEIKGKTEKLGVITYDFTDAKKLLSFFSYDGDILNRFPGCIFRGHSSEHYQLRSIVKRNKIHGGMVTPSFLEELNELSSFADLMNRRELFLPYGGSLFSRPTDILLDMDRWIPKEYLDFAAFAQHSGIPTRMLDWTYDFPTALWFAASGIVNKIWKVISSRMDEKGISRKNFYAPDECKAIVNECESQLQKLKTSNGTFHIWSFNLPQWDRITNPLKSLFKDDLLYDVLLRFHAPFYAENNNARVQKGLLSYFILKKGEEDIRRMSPNEKLQYWNDRSTSREDNLSLDEYIESFTKTLLWYRPFSISAPFLYQFTLPFEEAYKAYRLLKDQDYTESAIYPSTAVCVKEIHSHMNNELMEEAFQRLVR